MRAPGKEIVWRPYERARKGGRCAPYGAASGPALIDQSHQLDDVAHAELLQHARLVDLHGAWADAELLGNAPVVQALDDQCHHLALTRR